MKNIYKISVVFFVGLSIIVYSCKKEEDELIIEGCTDSIAMNYLSDATSNNGSCVYAYDIAQGLWDISSACDIVDVFGFEIPLDSLLPKTIEITGEGEGVVSMDINGEDVLADIANDGVVTIKDDQTISFDTSDFDLPVSLGTVDIKISGSGIISSDANGDLLLNFKNTLLSIDADCAITFTR